MHIFKTEPIFLLVLVNLFNIITVLLLQYFFRYYSIILNLYTFGRAIEMFWGSLAHKATLPYLSLNYIVSLNGRIIFKPC